MRSSEQVTLRRFPAEWEDAECVMLAWPHEQSDWNYILEDARTTVAQIVEVAARYCCVLLIGPAELCRSSVESYNFDPKRVRFVDVPTNDTWVRDFGPLSVEVNGSLHLLDFKFNGWGLKFPADKDNLVTGRLFEAGLFTAQYENRLNYVLEGGSVESDGMGTLLTTSECLLSPNRNGGWNEDRIVDYLKSVFGIDNLLMLRKGALSGDDTDSHIDTLARLAPGNTIIYCGSGNESNPNHHALESMLLELVWFRTRQKEPYNLIELPLPDPIEIDGELLPATYANYLLLPGAILLPSYRQPRKDFLASQVLKIAYPEREVISIDCVTLIRQHGSLHCMTMQLPAGAIADIVDGNWLVG